MNRKDFAIFFLYTAFFVAEIAVKSGFVWFIWSILFPHIFQGITILSYGEVFWITLIVLLIDAIIPHFIPVTNMKDINMEDSKQE